MPITEHLIFNIHLSKCRIHEIPSSVLYFIMKTTFFHTCSYSTNELFMIKTPANSQSLKYVEVVWKSIINYPTIELTYPSDKSIFSKIKIMIITTRLKNPRKLPYSIFKWLKGFPKQLNIMNARLISPSTSSLSITSFD